MYNQPNIIGQNTPNPAFGNFNRTPLQQARASGAITEYKFVAIKPKKQLAQLTAVLKSEPKKFLGIKYGKKFNLKDRCVVCGFHHIWQQGDYMRPPIPLDKVTKGRPLMGTYCPKHASMYMQLEMLQQQILADKHGLDFAAFKPRMPKILKSGPLTTLNKNDVASLTSAGWFIKPPALADNKTATEEVIRLVTEVNIMTDRINHLLLNNQIKVPEEETEE